MTISAAVDSRDYVVALPLRSAEDIPRDFGYSGCGEFISGVFLPRDDPDWFGRSKYPARLLLQFENRVSIIPHPKSRMADPIHADIEDLEAVESGRVLLVGWIRLHGREVTEIPYNRRTSEPVEDWLRALRRRLCPLGDCTLQGWPTCGDPLDVKFRNALASELESGEVPVSLWFKVPVEHVTGYRMFSRKITSPGRLVATMDNRVLWVTDRIRHTRERYGYVATYAPSRHVFGVSVEPDGARVILKSGKQWSL